jgi:hypothetical protein
VPVVTDIVSFVISGLADVELVVSFGIKFVID